jgi:hypothetical protein
MTPIAKKIPRPMPRPGTYMDTAPFWRAANDGKLLIQVCTETGRPQFFPRPVSLATGRKTVAWREASGRGTVYSFTVTRNAWPGHEDRAPYVCALIDLEEGVRMLANLVNADIAGLRIGMPVRLTWERLSDDINYPAFEPA